VGLELHPLLILSARAHPLTKTEALCITIYGTLPSLRARSHLFWLYQSCNIPKCIWAAWSGRDRPRNECRRVQTCLTAQVQVHVFNCSSYIYLTVHSDCVRFTQRCACSRARVHIGKIHTHEDTQRTRAHAQAHICMRTPQTYQRQDTMPIFALPACTCVQVHATAHLHPHQDICASTSGAETAELCLSTVQIRVNFNFFAQCMISSGFKSSNLRRRPPSSHSATLRCLKRACVAIMLVESS
jgi:hypothetical protein